MSVNCTESGCELSYKHVHCLKCDYIIQILESLTSEYKYLMDIHIHCDHCDETGYHVHCDECDETEYHTHSPRTFKSCLEEGCPVLIEHVHCLKCDWLGEFDKLHNHECVKTPRTPETSEEHETVSATKLASYCHLQ